MTFAAKRAYLLLLPLALTLTGCGIGNVLPSSDASDPTVVPTYTITGTVHGPHTLTGHTANPKVIIPVSNATVYLYAAGTAGYGSAATLLAETSTSTDGNATFSFTQNSGHTNSLTNISNTYACPSYTFNSPDGTTHITKDALIYLIVAAGDTQDGGSGTGHNNTGSVLMAALGDCANAASLFINVDEVTTVASVFSLANYMSPIYPTATVQTVGSGATATPTINTGSIASVTVNTGGTLYTTAPTVVFTDPNGTGSGAVATATVVNGTVTAINVTSGGTGYSAQTTVSFTSNNASGTVTLIGGALGSNMPATGSYQTAYGSGTNGGYTSTGTNKAVAIAPLAYTGLVNAFANVNHLVTLSTGAAVASFTNTATVGGASVTVTGTPEQAKLNTIADILAGCVDSPGPTSQGCATNLFAYAKPPISSATTALGSGTSFTTATDTLQAAWYMATNPTDNTTYGASTAASTTNLGKMFANVSGTSNFQPVLSGQPTDWTLSIAYSGSTTCGTDTSTGAFISTQPFNAATDLAGNLFVTNGTSSSGTLIELSNTGAPAACLLGGEGNLRGVIVDPNGNLWAASNTINPGLYKTSESSPTAPTLWSTVYSTEATTPYAVVADGSGNIFFTVNTLPTTPAVVGLYEFAGAQTTNTYVNPTIIDSSSFSAAASLYSAAADASGNIWVGDGGTDAIYAYGVNNTSGGYTFTTIVHSASYYYVLGVAIGASGNVFGGNLALATATDAPGTNFKTVPTFNAAGSVTANTTTHSTLVTNTPNNGLLGAKSIAIDGAGNLWNGVESAAAGTATTGIWSVAEMDSSFDALSPTTNAAVTGSNCTFAGQLSGALTCENGGGYEKAALGISRGITIDISGDVWVPSDQSANATPTGNVVEIIGAAVPVVPLAVAARDNKLATKP